MLSESDKVGIATQKILDRLESDFVYHSPKEGQPQLYGTIREKAKEYAKYLVNNTPVSREQSLALTKLEECVFWANAAIARNS